MRTLFVAVLIGFAACYGYNQSTEAPAPEGPVPTPPDNNPPGQVGRLALIEGAVSFRPAAGDTWAIPTPNRPVTTGDALWVDTVGHVEVEIGANSLRASDETEMDVVHLDDDMLQVRIPQGSVDLRVRDIDMRKDYEIDAPNAAIVFDMVGEYRIDVSPSGDTTRVTTWSGHAQVTANGSSFAVDPGQTAYIRGDSASTTYDLASAGSPDDFDRWSRDRNDREDRASVSAKYASIQMGGLEDLDAYGAWVDNPDYGSVWFPNTVDVGWAPYAFGDWVWVDPWGWTWVDNYPWGWAPFHYGRWAFIGDRWGWCPGPFDYDPFWGPGFVAFVGGPAWGFGVGWFALAPHEPYIPWYRTDLRYRERINVHNMANVNTINYRNRSIPGAVTAVPSRSFGNGEPIGRTALHPTPEQLRGVGVLSGGPGVTPTQRSLVGAHGFERPATIPPARLANRSVVALHAPPPARAHLSGTRGSEPPFRSAARPFAGGGGLRPARAGLPATSPVAPRGFTRANRSELDNSFAHERQQLESRHIQEFANPQSNESRAQIYQRQEAEHRELINRYNTARTQGMTRMPPPPRPSGGGHHR